MKKFPVFITFALSFITLSSCGSQPQPPAIYTVSFKNWDSTLLSESRVVFGETVIYEGPTPSRPETSEYRYTFAGWDQPLENITSDCVRVAQFNPVAKPVTIYYTVSFKNWDGTLLYEDTVESGGTAIFDREEPNRPETDEYTYTFIGWDQPLENITNDCVRIAQYNPVAKQVTKYYTVTFKNWDGSFLGESTVEEGKTAVYDGATPSRPSTPQYTYTFAGWNGSLENIREDTVLVAQFTPTNVEYSVKFFGYDNQLLYEDTVYYMEPASYYGPIPSKPATGTHTYTFKEWDKDFSCITKNISIYPIFNEIGITTSVTVKPNNGESDYTLDVTYGENYDLGTPNNPGYAFVGWYINNTDLISNSGVWEYIDVTFISARWETGNLNFALNEDNSSYSVSLTAEGKTKSEIVIPSIYNDLPITTLGAEFAKNNTSIQKITIPGSVTSIPNDSFNGCTNLSEAVLNSGLLTIGNSAFRYCKLQKIIIPSTCTSIGNSAFDYNSALYHIYIPSSVVNMGTYAFDEINSAAYICIEHESTPSDWPSSWTNTIVYTKATKLVETDDFNYVVISDFGDLSLYLVRLGEATKKLQNFAFPSAIEGISDIKVGYKLFYNNSYIRNLDLTSVTRIADMAFTSCSNLNTVTFGNSLVHIGKQAFRYCTSLARVELPDGLTTIQEMAFDGCSNLLYVYVPSTVSYIGQYAFDDCDKATIYTNAHAAGGSWSSSWKGDSPAYFDFVSLHEAEDFNYVIQSYQDKPYITITGIKANAKTKASITIPNEIDGINDIRLITKLFYGFTELVSIDVGSGVTNIPESCFYGCSNLQTVTLHEGLTSIGKTAFYHDYKLASINMPSTLTSVGYSAFDQCTSLKEVVIPVKCSTLASYAFDVNGKISLLIEASVNQPNWATDWYGSSSSNKQFVYDYKSSGLSGEFRYAKASNGVTDIIHILGLVDGSVATNLVVPDQIEGISNIKIADYAFQNNTILKTIDLGNSITYIGTYAFNSNSSLRSVIIPATCVVIKTYAFANCSKECVLHCMMEEAPSTWESNWNNNGCQLDWNYLR